MLKRDMDINTIANRGLATITTSSLAKSFSANSPLPWNTVSSSPPRFLISSHLGLTYLSNRNYRWHIKAAFKTHFAVFQNYCMIWRLRRNRKKISVRWGEEKKQVRERQKDMKKEEDREDMEENEGEWRRVKGGGVMCFCVSAFCVLRRAAPSCVHPTFRNLFL